MLSDQRHGGLAQSPASKLDAATTSLSEDPSRSWSQSNLLLYQAASAADHVKTEAQKVGIKVETDDGATNGPMSSQERQYYGVDALGQIVRCKDDRKSQQLETELVHLRSALSEKNSEVQGLSLKLEEAYRVIERYKQQFSELAMSTSSSSQPATSSSAIGPSSDDHSDGVATTAAVTSASSMSG